MDFQKLIKETLKQKDMTQRQLAAETGVQQASISRIASGQYHNISWQTGAKLIDYAKKHKVKVF